MTKSTSRTSKSRKAPPPMQRKHVLLIVLAAILLALAAGGAWLGITARDRAALERAGQERANTLELARGYMERQEYDEHTFRIGVMYHF